MFVDYFKEKESVTERERNKNKLMKNKVINSKCC